MNTKKAKTKKIKTECWAGTTWFVDEKNGSDDNDGLSVDTAFKTERNAYLHCGPRVEDVIIVLPDDNDGLSIESSFRTARIAYLQDTIIALPEEKDNG